ncbi:BON domain-containing protein [Alteromonas sp. ASW11-130]|uniref:BON domain-containing protein n=1 Tax=Alteromonas sp. ASW11-130 TaxID=3015775 RepID=UPI0022422186|nr:BON domain-containing protein [Alteromonas sp. ASW11-130]MCW8090295.1 BON domain-containing protein [Alteromonas sp. ASW11-130]
MKRSILSLIVAGTLSTSVVAAGDNTWEESAKDAWIDGKAEATLLFNGNLDSFDINTDVQNGKVILTGKVDNSVEKKLAEELVRNIDGVTDVENQLAVVEKPTTDADKLERENERMLASKDISEDQDYKVENKVDNATDEVDEETDELARETEDEVDEGVSALTDAKIATVVKTRLLMDSDISGFDIDVDVKDGNVTLSGNVDSDAERQLAVEIARNADDVRDVEDNMELTRQTAMQK